MRPREEPAVTRSRGRRPSGRPAATAAAWAAPSIPTASPDTTTAPTRASASAIRAAIRARPRSAGGSRRPRPRAPRSSAATAPRTNSTGGGSSIRAQPRRVGGVVDGDDRDVRRPASRARIASGLARPAVPDRRRPSASGQPDPVASRSVADRGAARRRVAPARGPAAAAVLAEQQRERRRTEAGTRRPGPPTPRARRASALRPPVAPGVRAARDPEPGGLLEMLVPDAVRAVEVGDRPGDPQEPADPAGRAARRPPRSTPSEGLVDRPQTARRPEPRPVEPGVGDALAGQGDRARGARSARPRPRSDSDRPSADELGRGTGGISTHRSIRSRSGPETRPA